jgi:phosphatidylserine decarboxylase
MKSTKNIITFFHPEGWRFVAIFAAATILLSFVDLIFLYLGLILTAWCLYFFRDPDRTTPTRPGLIISPADGRVVAITELTPDPDLELGTEIYTRISIFLNVFDVHVNRIPADGLVRLQKYRAGKFLNASLDKASVDNERAAVILELSGDHKYDGKLLGVVQIAGLIARRIVCKAKAGDRFKTGERFGIIRFGSRTDVYLPAGIQPLVSVGQYMLGGETVLADCQSQEPARQGEIRV